LTRAISTGAPDVHALAHAMSDRWIAFARTGEPNADEAPRWPSYDALDRATMIFNQRCKVENDPGQAQRQAIDNILFA